MHKSVRRGLTVGLLASSLVMLLVMPFLNNNNSILNAAIAQGYNTYGDSYSNIQQMIKNMNAEQDHLKASLYLQ